MPQVRLGLLVLGVAASPFAAAQTDIRPGLWNMSVEFSVPVPGATGCAISGNTASSGHFEFEVKCEGIFAIGGHGSVDYTPDALQGTVNLDVSLGDPRAARRTGSASRIAARRVGDC